MSDFGKIDTMLDDLGFSVVVQRETRTSGSYTGDTVTWATFATVTGSMQNLGGTEAIRADKLGIQATDILYISDILAITEADRVLYNSKYYQITYIDNVVNISKYMKIFLNRSDDYESGSN